MRVQVGRYPFFIESEGGQVEVEPLLSVGAVFESQLRAIDVEERANDRAYLGGIEEVRGHPQRQIARAQRSDQRRKNLLSSCLGRRGRRVVGLAIADAEKPRARAHSQSGSIDLDLDRMTAPVELLAIGIESEQIVALLIVERLFDADVQIVGVDDGESPGLVRHIVQPFERLLCGLQRVGVRCGAGAARDVRAGHKGLQSLRVYRVDDDARTVGQLDQILQALQDLLGSIVVIGFAVDAKTVGEQDHALSSGEVAQTANDEASRAERACGEAGLLELCEAVGHGLLFCLLFGLRRVHLVCAAGVGEGRHHVAAERVPHQFLDGGVKDAFVAGELFQHSKAGAGPDDGDQIAVLHLLADKFLERLARELHARRRETHIVHDESDGSPNLLRRNLSRRHRFRRDEKAVILLSRRLAPRRRQADVREMGQLLLLSVHQQLEIALGQILDVFALLVGDDGVHLHKLRGDAHHILPLRRGGLRLQRRDLRFVGRRLMRESGPRNANNQYAYKNKNDRTLKSGHTHPGGDGKTFYRGHISYAICHISYGIWHINSQFLLCPLRRELLSWLVSSLSGARHLDLVSGEFPFVEKRDFVPLEVELERERNLVPADLAVGDWIVALHSRHGSRQLFPFRLEGESRFAGLAASSRNLGGPFAIDIRCPGQRQGGEHKTY